MGQIELNKHLFRSEEFQSVVNKAIAFFSDTPVHELPLPTSFQGAGVYALYYSGDFRPYLPLSKLNETACAQPIYIGKAVPPGWRTGRQGDLDDPALYRRLNEHTRSVNATQLAAGDFRARFIILAGVETDLIVPVEAELIRRFQPLWNTTIDGFGNHDPGQGRYNQAVSEWDVLHPGRAWADRLTGSKPDRSTILQKIDAHFQND